MNRFFGMMPADEVEKEVKYLDGSNNIVIIQAGKHGWTVIYDISKSTNYKDENDTVENNFAKALAVAEDNCRCKLRRYE